MNPKMMAKEKMNMRSPWLDSAKFLSALAVIWIHACQSSELSFTSSVARFAVPFFVAASAYALVQSLAKKQSTWLRFIWQKWKRLYVPFAVWTVAYLLFKLVKRVLLPEQDCDLPGLEVLWQGGAYHLWFIPFLLGASILLFPCLQWGLQRRDSCYTASLLWALVGMVAAFVAPKDDGQGMFVILVAQALPGLCGGVAIGFLAVASPDRRLNFSSSQFVLLFGTCLLLLLCTARETLLENVSGCCLLLWALATESQSFTKVEDADSLQSNSWAFSVPAITTTFAWLGQYALGIYFCHLMILKVGEALLKKVHVEPGIGQDIGLFVVTSVVATMVALLIARQKSLRWLVC